MVRAYTIAAAVLLLLACGRPSAAEIKAIVEAEEDVYRYKDANNGSGPSWCFGSTCIIRSGDDMLVSGIEKIAGATP